MSTTSVVQFMQKTAEDIALREQLESLLGVGDGDISSAGKIDAAEAEALRGDRAPKVAEFAAARGYRFSVADLIAVVDTFQKYQSGELSDADFVSILGLNIDTAQTDTLTDVTKPLQRLARYLSKTYLGL